MMNNHNHNHNQKGFTIIELLIATAVLSTILILVTVVMVNIGTLYYKGINQAKVQDSARSITDEITRTIQLNDQPPTAIVDGPNNTKLVCIGAVRYAYVLGAQIGHQAPPPTPVSTTIYHHVLWRDNNPTPGSCPKKVDPGASAPDPAANDIDLTTTNWEAADPSGAELIADNSRLTQFSMSTSSPSLISVGVAYGDDDLLCNSTIANSCTTPNAMNQWPSYYTIDPTHTGDVICKGAKGDQFCSTASLTTSAVLRIAGGEAHPGD